VLSLYVLCSAKTKILLLAALGVIESDRPVSAKVVDATVVEVLYVAFTTCKTFPPPAGEAHFRPVGETELSAVKTVPFAPTVSLANVSAPVPTIKSAFAS